MILLFLLHIYAWGLLLSFLEKKYKNAAMDNHTYFLKDLLRFIKPLTLFFETINIEVIYTFKNWKILNNNCYSIFITTKDLRH